MKYLILSILALHFVTFPFSYYGFDKTYLALDGAQMVLACCAIYLFCPMRRWGFKILSFISAVASVGVFIHNMLLEAEIMSEGVSAVYSIGGIGLVLLVIGPPLLGHWKKLPNDEITPGNIYEIIGKPRTEWQFVLFVLTCGRGGSYAITDGKHIIKMDRELGMSIPIKFNNDYLHGKKCVKIGGNSTFNAMKFNDKLNIKFTYLRNCYWISRGFKNG